MLRIIIVLELQNKIPSFNKFVKQPDKREESTTFEHNAISVISYFSF